jgi:putative ATPase
MKRASAPDLFDLAAQETLQRSQPLAARMRARSFDEYVGQEDIIGPGRLLRRAIEADKLFSSILLWGPPGTGKTTLAMIIAHTTRSHFEQINAVMSGVADIRHITAEAQERLKLYRQRTILLIDEIHRFNKAQQDALLPHRQSRKSHRHRPALHTVLGQLKQSYQQGFGSLHELVDPLRLTYLYSRA